MNSPSERALRLTDAIYAAAVTPERWTDFLVALSDDLGGAAIAMSHRFPGLESPTEYYRVHLSAEFTPIFERYIRLGLPWGPMTDSIFREGFGFANRNFPDAQLSRTDYYLEYMQPQGLAPEGPIAHLIDAQGPIPISGICINRREGGRRLGGDDLELCNLLVPHLHLAHETRDQIRASQHEHEIRAEVLDRIPTGVIVVDEDHHVAGTNRSGLRIADQRDGIYIDAHLLRASDLHEDAVLRGLIDDAIGQRRSTSATAGEEPSTKRSGGFMTIARPSGNRSLTAWVSPLLEAPADSAVGDRVAALFITDPSQFSIERDEFRTAFARMYDLTPAEADLVALLAEGNSLEQISEARGVTIITTRSQLKTIFAKTATSRQAEIIRLALTGVATVHNE